MKTCVVVLFLISGGFFGQDYYSFESKTFFDKGYANDTVHLEQLNQKLLQAAVFHQTNIHRPKTIQFSFDSNLEKAAMFHSQEMQNRGFFSHINRKNSKYKTPALRAKKYNAEFSSIGENILEETAINYEDNSMYDFKLENNKQVFYHTNNGKKIRELTYKELAVKIVTSWMNSSEHKMNILDKSYSHLGVGIAVSVNPLFEDNLPFVLVTQLFGGKKQI